LTKFPGRAFSRPQNLIIKFAFWFIRRVLGIATIATFDKDSPEKIVSGQISVFCSLLQVKISDLQNKIDFMSQATATGKHPRGLYVLFATEMWERFNYYGMRAILIYFMTQALLFKLDFASNLYGSYISLLYLTPLVGGYIADPFGVISDPYWLVVL
jgi:hypothetical protein